MLETWPVVREILAFDGDKVEIMDWELKRHDEGFGLGDILYVSPRDNYRGDPTGMGGRNAMARS